MASRWSPPPRTRSSGYRHPWSARKEGSTTGPDRRRHGRPNRRKRDNRRDRGRPRRGSPGRASRRSGCRGRARRTRREHLADVEQSLSGGIAALHVHGDGAARDIHEVLLGGRRVAARARAEEPSLRALTAEERHQSLAAAREVPLLHGAIEEIERLLRKTCVGHGLPNGARVSEERRVRPHGLQRAEHRARRGGPESVVVRRLQQRPGEPGPDLAVVMDLARPPRVAAVVRAIPATGPHVRSIPEARFTRRGREVARGAGGRGDVAGAGERLCRVRDGEGVRGALVQRAGSALGPKQSVKDSKAEVASTAACVSSW